MEIIILGILILINGFFSLSEIALVSSKRVQLERAKAEGSRGAEVALKLLGKSENFLSAIQVGITLIGIVTGVYGGINIADDITPLFKNIEIFKNIADEMALTLTVIIITYISIVIGELVPKTIGLSNPEKIAIRVAPIVYYFSRAFYPLVRLLSSSTNIINKLLGIRKKSEAITEADLRYMIKAASIEGIIEQEQKNIYEKIFYFADKKAKHLMTHRTDVEWVDVNKPEEDIRETLQNVHHSKVVCCRDNLDNIAGILYLKDYFKMSANRDLKDISELIHQPLIVPESADAQKVLNLLRQNKVHICCIVNEYGGFEGIITFHDIVENILGEMPEENEFYEPDVFIREDNSLLVGGDAPIETLVDIIDGFTVDFEKIDYSTVAGFIISQVNDIPKTGDIIYYKGYQFEIIDLDGSRIDKILIKKQGSHL